jgi:hypothetical protein
MVAVASLLGPVLGIAGFQEASADEGGAYWGYGKTYQNNWNASCQWYDVQHDDMSDQSCYQGVWSDTSTYDGSSAEVSEYAQHQTWGSSGNVVHVYYVGFGAIPLTGYGNGYVSVNHYYCGDVSCHWPVNVIGYAYHYGPNGNDYIYTQSLWGNQYAY